MNSLIEFNYYVDENYNMKNTFLKEHVIILLHYITEYIFLWFHNSHLDIFDTIENQVCRRVSKVNASLSRGFNNVSYKCVISLTRASLLFNVRLLLLDGVVLARIAAFQYNE